jgi:ribonuclease P protein component
VSSSSLNNLAMMKMAPRAGDNYPLCIRVRRKHKEKKKRNRITRRVRQVVDPTFDQHPLQCVGLAVTDQTHRAIEPPGYQLGTMYADVAPTCLPG